MRNDTAGVADKSETLETSASKYTNAELELEGHKDSGAGSGDPKESVNILLCQVSRVDWTLVLTAWR
jgi:hypothetical protein